MDRRRKREMSERGTEWVRLRIIVVGREGIRCGDRCRCDEKMKAQVESHIATERHRDASRITS